MRRAEYAILLAEDDENDILLTKRAFKKAGLDNKLFVVRNGEEAIKYLAGEGSYADRDKHPLPNLVITDLKMPKKNGRDLIHWIRENPRLRDLQVFVLSSAQEREHAALEVEANAYLRKSADGDELEDMVHGLASFVEDLQSSLQKSSISFAGLSENGK